MATAPDRQHHSHCRRRISRSALGLQRHLSHQHRASLRLSGSPTRPRRSVSLQRDRDADSDVLNEIPSLKSQAPGELQAPNLKTCLRAFAVEFDDWDLVLPWVLGFGVWSFRRRLRSGDISSGYKIDNHTRLIAAAKLDRSISSRGRPKKRQTPNPKTQGSTKSQSSNST